MSLNEITERAKRKLPVETWEHIMGVAETGYTYRRNLAIFRSILLKQRVFHGYSEADTSIKLFNQELRSPILISPIGSFHMIRATADLEVAAGAAKTGSMLFISHASKTSLEAYTQNPHPPLVWMGYFSLGYEEVFALAKKAETLGYAAVGVTVDTVQPTKLGYTIPMSVKGGPRKGYSLTIKELQRLRKEVSVPIVAKGVMCKEDAEMAAEAGVNAIIISNHGGRVLDYNRSALEALPEIVEAVGRKIDVLIDSGFRRGTDILKALALGAKAVLIGRPICWGVITAGADGVARVIDVFAEELKRSMLLCGVNSIDRISREILIFDKDSPVS